MRKCDGGPDGGGDLRPKLRGGESGRRLLGCGSRRDESEGRAGSSLGRYESPLVSIGPGGGPPERSDLYRSSRPKGGCEKRPGGPRGPGPESPSRESVLDGRGGYMETGWSLARSPRGGYMLGAGAEEAAPARFLSSSFAFRSASRRSAWIRRRSFSSCLRR